MLCCLLSLRLLNWFVVSLLNVDRCLLLKGVPCLLFNAWYWLLCVCLFHGCSLCGCLLCVDCCCCLSVVGCWCVLLVGSCLLVLCVLLCVACCLMVVAW